MVHDRDAPVSYSWLVRATLLVLALAALLWLFGRLSHVLLLFFGVVTVAVILHSAADLVRKVIPLHSRAALAVVVCLIAALFICFVFLLGTQIAAQLSDLSRELPLAVNSVGSRLGITSLWGQVEEFGGSGWMSDLIGFVPNLVGMLASVILIVVGGIFLAADPKMYVEGFLKLVPVSHRDEVRQTAHAAGRALRLWLAGKLIAMAAIGAITTLGLSLLGVPSALALGLIAGLLEFIPFVGAILGFLPAGLVALQQDGLAIWWVLGLYVLVQQIENNVMVPLIQQHTVELPPVLGLFSIVALGVVFGPYGVIFGVPLTVVLLVAVKRLYVRGTLGGDVEIPGGKGSERLT